MKFIDIAANLTDPIFRGIYRGKKAHPDDFLLVLKRAAAAGVEKIMVTAGSVKESQEALELACQHESLFSTVGCHPTRCSEFEQDPEGPDGYYQKMLQIATSEKAKGRLVAIGECGLDYDRTEFCPKEIQLKYFPRHFALAEATGLPMFFHCRNTGNDFYSIVKQYRHKFKTGCVHSFTGTEEEMLKLIELDLYIGINGCSLKTPENFEVMKKIPADRILLETDAPWCDIRPTHASHIFLAAVPKDLQALYAPASKKKEKFEEGLMVNGRNEPCSIGHVLYAVAGARGVDPEKFAAQVYENTCRIYFPN
ncbi:uncharacterized protein VTP21DRAFT_3961 [Calcarisporiella thermophila]|uniref:uncharacterized protein n=1 Tax=Calcarisporiella thermophila TaxID=911321 RepID=UPI0037446914